METNDFLMRCGDCDKILGAMTLFYVGVPHHASPSFRCMPCVSKVDLSTLSIEQQEKAKRWLHTFKLESQPG